MILRLNAPFVQLDVAVHPLAGRADCRPCRVDVCAFEDGAAEIPTEEVTKPFSEVLQGHPWEAPSLNWRLLGTASESLSVVDHRARLVWAEALGTTVSQFALKPEGEA